ncbi:carbamoyltransferase HypF [Tenggerimyces flavus]|uniref:Carbamoyltransferase n=1 Tax=Tenggerimyces flavus TaxID=1708749 RepID=A0ABV7YPS8_9ACTN|nr:carbamoyltransferase HypF [Tenggerimyces flavus]MBM7790115.1 hydrogenase maturation protein HypF [Tenggerimyces flavus]
MGASAAGAASRERRRVLVSGVVQGVGFRPFVYALAREHGLSGWVGNDASGVHVEVEGEPAAVAAFCVRIAADAPPLAVVESVLSNKVAVRGGTEFVIHGSSAGSGRTLVSPDVATCTDCLRELADPSDRRYRHPFISCVNCGPRFTIITGLPHDRATTTMTGFPMCENCAREYADPADRRFHAQPIACPRCGPRLWWRQLERPELTGAVALSEARELLAAGGIVAVKGLGGYHLACDATNTDAVTTLRKRKDRGDKPLALMVTDLDAARRYVAIDAAERELLSGPRRPIVLMRRLESSIGLADLVAPGSPDVGIMLPYTPLHRLLLGLPSDAPGLEALVMTSGNVSGEPIVIDDAEAAIRLAPLVDGWLGHDRPIHVPCDDSVVRVVDGIELPIRRSRGYAPFPISLPLTVRPALATGGDLKNTFCIGEERYAWLSAHIGDMDDLATIEAFDRATSHAAELTGVRPELIVTDRHPRYRCGQWATRVARGREVVRVQHHHAHIASVMAEHEHLGSDQVIGFAFDGTGYGDDGAVWGGEVLLADYDGFTRAAHLSYVALPGGDAGVRNPCRMALSHLRSAGIGWTADLPSVAACTPTELGLLDRQLERGIACVPTSSMGRLFDSVASLAGVCHRVGYEAQAAIELEGRSVDHVETCGDAYELGIVSGSPLVLDPAPMLHTVVRDVRAGVLAGVIGARFHRAIVDAVVNVALLLRERTGLDTVAMSGGVFLNRLLVSLCANRLAAEGFTVLRPCKVPPSDAGLALGQLLIAARQKER